MLMEMGWSREQLEQEGDQLGDALANHFGDAPAWQLMLVLCYTLATFVCETAQTDYESSGRFYMWFFLLCLEELAPLLVDVPETSA